MLYLLFRNIMLFLGFIHTFDTFVIYSNIQIVEALTISPPHKKIYDKDSDASGSLSLYFIQNSAGKPSTPAGFPKFFHHFIKLLWHIHIDTMPGIFKNHNFSLRLAVFPHFYRCQFHWDIKFSAPNQ